MKFLVDANVLSEPGKPVPEQRVVDWLDEQEFNLWVSVITLGEIEKGIQFMKGGELEDALDIFRKLATPVAFPFTDRLRPGAINAVAGLQALGLRVVLMSGDADGPVAVLASKIGIAEFTGRLSPADKAARIAILTAQGHRVLMIGDGLNDTAALVAAHVSIAPASALDAARVAADIVLLGSDLAPVAEAVRMARLSLRRMRQNFAISIAYNVIAVPFALLGFATPLMSAIAMSLSSITVSLNAMRMRSP